MDMTPEQLVAMVKICHFEDRRKSVTFDTASETLTKIGKALDVSLETVSTATIKLACWYVDWKVDRKNGERS